MTDRTKPAHPSRLFGPWRRRFQWATSLVILLLPWLQPYGKSLLRIDISSLSLHIFGQVLRIEELYLVLFFALALGVAFFLVTLVTGRVWCGWACPQTTWNDLAEWFAERLGLRLVNNRLEGAAWRKLLAQVSYLILGALVAANLIWYFVEPQRFFRTLFNGEMSFGLWTTLIALWLLFYLDLAVVRRLMCRDFCPYGRFQTALVDPGTLTLRLPDDERPRCIKCNSCVRCCPMEIDIREGYQVECINCGRCLDACRQVMAERSEPGLIYYTVGTEDKGVRALLNPRTLILGLLLLSLVTCLGVAIYGRSETSLKIALSHTVDSRLLKDGRQATFFTAWINNRSTDSHSYWLKARSQEGAPLELKGQTENLQVAGGMNRKIEYILVSSPVRQPFMVTFILVDAQQRQLVSTEAQVSPLR